MRIGSALMIGGLVLVGLGAILRWAPWLVSWFGNLPGDIRYEGTRTSVFIPITSMLILSLIASLIYSFIRRGGA